ncbi:MAG: ATP-binding protein [Sinimarinibacterium sp.]
MKSPLFWKLFALQLLAAAVLLGGALFVTRQYTERSFFRFLEARERDHLHEVADEIAEAYRRTGDLFEAVRLADERAPPRPWRPRRGEPPPPLTVVAADGEVIRGERRALVPDALREPIEVDGRVIGTVQRPPLPERHALVDAEFSKRQSRGLRLVLAGALVVAALFAALLTVLILKPLRRLSDGVAALSRREFGTRLAVARGDELGQLAEDFNRLAEALERYDARQRQWLADIAHELRTPLAVLRGEIEAVIDGVRSADAAGTRSLHQEVLRLQTLVDDLHLLSLAESGGLRLQREVTDVNELVADVAQRWRARCRERGFTLEASPSSAPARAVIDAQRIEQVLVNLLENALRHASPPGPVCVRVVVADGSVRVAVSDSGPGVPDQALARLFDRLYRVEAARSRVHGGSGLGLAICRSIIEAHGGDIVARHSAQGGLEIEFRLTGDAG